MKEFKKLAFFSLVILIGISLLSISGCNSEEPNEEPNGDKAPATNDALEFFNGKVITIIVPYSPGGGFDTVSRMVAPLIQDAIPGSTVIVENVPGAGGMVGANELYHAKPDGLTIGIQEPVGLLVNQLKGEAGVNYDINEFIYLARANSANKFWMVRADGPYQTYEDVLNSEQEIKFAFTGEGSIDVAALRLEEQMFDFPVKYVFGFGTTADIVPSILRGEVDAVRDPLSTFDTLLEEKELIPVLAISVERDTLRPDVPTILEICKEEDKETATFLASLSSLQRVFVAPPEVPEERIKILEEAFKQALNDQQLVDSLLEKKIEITYLDGEAVTEILSLLHEGFLKHSDLFLK